MLRADVVGGRAHVTTLWRAVCKTMRAIVCARARACVCIMCIMCDARLIEHKRKRRATITTYTQHTHINWMENKTESAHQTYRLTDSDIQAYTEMLNRFIINLWYCRTQAASTFRAVLLLFCWFTQFRAIQSGVNCSSTHANQRDAATFRTLLTTHRQTENIIIMSCMMLLTTTQQQHYENSKRARSYTKHTRKSTV